MSFYHLSKLQRAEYSKVIASQLIIGFKSSSSKVKEYFSNDDTYIRKVAYIATGRIYFQYTNLQHKIIDVLNELLSDTDYKVRQTAINASGEIAKKDFAVVEAILEKGLFDNHHSPRNAVIGSIKKAGEVNPIPVLSWAKKFIHHPDKEIRREICHGIELRGRRYPQDILPILKELQFDNTKRVQNTLVHVLGQISYKAGCLQTVISDIRKWENRQLVLKALEEIIDVHDRYKNFAVLSQQDAIKYINENFHKKPLATARGSYKL